MLTFVFSMIFIALIVLITSWLVVAKIIEDKKAKEKSNIKSILKSSIIFTNLLIVAQMIIIVLFVVEVITDVDFTDSIMFAYMPYVFAIFSVALTTALILYKERKTLYVNNSVKAPYSDICNYCSLNQLKIEQNTIDEDEILRLLKEQPEKLDYVRKILK